MIYKVPSNPNHSIRLFSDLKSEPTVSRFHSLQSNENGGESYILLCILMW